MPNAALQIARNLIARSVSDHEVVTHEYSADVAALLDRDCDYSVDANDGRAEYWGVTEDGEEWRVRLVPAEGEAWHGPTQSQSVRVR